MTQNDFSALLPDGRSFDFWERTPVWERELFVSSTDPNASDDNDGSLQAPFRTIGRAAKEAVPGTRVRIHAGVYRECVRPERGGDGPEHMISYEAFGDGPAVISASEEVSAFLPSEGWSLRMSPEETENIRIWEYDLDPDLFRGYNPFCAVNILHDRLFIEYDKTDMTTYLNRRGGPAGQYLLGGSQRHEGALPPGRGCGPQRPPDRGDRAGAVLCPGQAVPELHPCQRPDL